MSKQAPTPREAHEAAGERIAAAQEALTRILVANSIRHEKNPGNWATIGDRCAIAAALEEIVAQFQQK